MTGISLQKLRTIPLFGNLNETERRQLGEISKRVEFQPGDVILRQGEVSQNLWILLEGTCQVLRHPEPDALGETVVLAHLDPHNIFGEMSFFHKAPHSASVCALTAVKLLRINRADYDELIREGAWGAYKLAYNAASSMAERLRRMDDWVTELLQHQPQQEAEEEPEWSRFKSKLFNGWTL